jgi:hypothetical protein
MDTTVLSAWVRLPSTALIVGASLVPVRVMVSVVKAVPPSPSLIA